MRHTLEKSYFIVNGFGGFGPWMLALCITLICGGDLKGQQLPGSLDQHKARLEIQKLELEISQIKQDHNALPGWLTGGLGFLAGIGGTVTSIWAARRARLGELDQSVHDKRLDLYPQLIAATAELAIFFPDYNGAAAINRATCLSIGRAMSKWYFGGGGLLMSIEARNAYFSLARALTRAALANKLQVPIFPEDSADVSVEKVDKYRKELRQTCNLYDVENWRFGDSGLENASHAQMFKDFIFLQRLSSILRTKLSEDLRSRRRPW